MMSHKQSAWWMYQVLQASYMPLLLAKVPSADVT